MLRRGAVLAVALSGLGCVATVPPSRSPGPTATALDAVPLATFGVEACGAGSLGAVLAALDHPVAVAELDAALPRAANGGVLTLDLVLAARARGLAARLSRGSREAVEAAVLGGLPPILALRVIDTPGRRRDYFHYVVADGVDPEQGLVRLQFGDGRRRWTSWRRIERAWRGAGHALVVIEPRPAGGAPPVPAEVRYAVSREAEGDLDGAAALYESLVARGAESALVWTNLGNVEAARGRAAAAEAAYRRALDLAPQHRDALNNLAWLLLEQDERLAEAEALAERAVAADGPDPYLPLDTLARVQRRRGDCGAAAESAARALALAPAAAPRAAIELELGLALVDCGEQQGARPHLEAAAASGDAAVRDAARRALSGG